MIIHFYNKLHIINDKMSANISIVLILITYFVIIQCNVKLKWYETMP